MSRKTKRNQKTAEHAEPNTGTQAATTPSSDRRNLFIVAAMVLLGFFIAATLVYRSQKAQSSEAAIAQNQSALASTHSPQFGDPGAKVHIVEFFDPACETCAAFFPQVKKLMAADPGRIRLSLRHVPFHKGSQAAVRMLEAARAQGKYLPTLEALYAAQGQWVINHEVRADALWNAIARVGLDLDWLRTDMDSPEIAQRMAQDMADAQQLGVTKTPEFFVNARPMPRFGLEELQALVKGELRRAYP